MLKKSLGQHLLINHAISKRIVDLYSEKSDILIEIGPGRGALTKLLLEKNYKKLFLIEKDPKMISFLQNNLLTNHPNIVIVEMDAVTLNIKKLLNEGFYNRITVISNLPYNVGTLILMNLLEQNIVDEFIVMLQEEVIDRFVANPSSKSYGKISILSQAQYELKKIFTVSPNSFTPQPKVNSAVMAIKPINYLDKKIYRELSKLCTIGFGQRRKQLAKLLKQHSSTYHALLQEFPIGLRRIEEISVTDLINMAKYLAK